MFAWLAEAKDLALDAHFEFRDNHSLTSWLDVKMNDRSEAAMQEGVRNSEKVFVILTESYFSRPCCLKELRWAKQFKKPIVVGIPFELKPKFDELMHGCPEDLLAISGIDCQGLNRSEPRYWELGIQILLEPNSAGFLHESIRDTPQAEVQRTPTDELCDEILKRT